MKCISGFLFVGLIWATPLKAADRSESLFDLLKQRDQEPSCAQLDQMGFIASDFRLVVKKTQPPWAAMRAAQCLVQLHGPSSMGLMSDWLTDLDSLGLAVLVMRNLDGMSPDLALRLAKVAKEGPYREQAQRRLALSNHRQVAALFEKKP